jgi:hypothetical protein
MDVLEDPKSANNFRSFCNAYLNRDELDLDELYKDYDAAADVPAACFYKEMLAKYPEAKVILTERPVEDWFKSVQNTIFKTRGAIVSDPTSPHYELSRFGLELVFDGLMKDPENLGRKELFIKKYLYHNAEVKRLVPAEKLYVMQIGEGWEGLCRFLGNDIPDVPYPSSNTTNSFNQSFKIDMPKCVEESEVTAVNIKT